MRVPLTNHRTQAHRVGLWGFRATRGSSGACGERAGGPPVFWIKEEQALESGAIPIPADASMQKKIQPRMIVQTASLSRSALNSGLHLLFVIYIKKAFSRS